MTLPKNPAFLSGKKGDDLHIEKVAYNLVKAQTVSLARSVIQQDSPEVDVWAHILSDASHPRQAAFVSHLASVLSEDQRKLLLDGLAFEYKGCRNWYEYLASEATK